MSCPPPLGVTIWARPEITRAPCSSAALESCVALVIAPLAMASASMISRPCGAAFSDWPASWATALGTRGLLGRTTAPLAATAIATLPPSSARRQAGLDPEIREDIDR